MLSNEIVMGQLLHVKTENMGRAVESKFVETSHLQFVREFTKNSEQAIQRSDKGYGHIVWDVANNLSALPWPDVEDITGRKLMIVDNGDSFSPAQLADLVTGMHESTGEKALRGQRGLGAKISAAPRNKLGLIYLAWRGDSCHVCRLRYNPIDEVYGLQRVEHEDGTWVDVAELDASEAKELFLGHLIRNPITEDHGTAVIFLGNTQEEDTVVAPGDSVNKGGKWLQHYLSRKWTKFASGVKVWTHDDTNPTMMRNVKGLHEIIDNASLEYEHTELSGATAHVWIMGKDEHSSTKPDGRPPSAQRAENGHFALIMDNEVYSFMSPSRGGFPKLSAFGIKHGTSRVILHIEPHAERFFPTESRNAILERTDEGTTDLPWQDWQREFEMNMPAKLRNFMEQQQLERSKNPRESFKDRLAPLLPLFDLGSVDSQSSGRGQTYYKTNADGKHRVSVLDLPGSVPREGGGGPRGEIQNFGETHGRGGSEGIANRRASKPTRMGTPARKVSLRKPRNAQKRAAIEEPEFIYLSVKGEKHIFPDFVEPRGRGVLEDRAVRYQKPNDGDGPGTVYINLDWDGFRDLVGLCLRHSGQAGYVSDATRQTAWRVMIREFESMLTQIILTCRNLDTRWTTEAANTALSEEALTVALCSREHIVPIVKAEITGKRRSA